jgi:hypothetical protein
MQQPFATNQREKRVYNCTTIANKLEGGREITEADKLYSSLTLLSTRANCDTQYDKTEAYTNYNVPMRESAIMVAIIGLGIIALSFWRSIR